MKNTNTTISTSWGYDTNTNDRRLIAINNSGITRSYVLGYTANGVTNPYDILSIADNAAAGHPFASQNHNYTYDGIDRLLTATATTPGNDTYAYDKLDNATTVTTPSGTTNPTYNGFNQIEAWGTLSYSYDADGNLLSGDGVKTYKWDAENRLVEIDYVGSTAKSQFSYDGVGHRTVDVETSATGTITTTRYLWCGSSICQTRDGSDNVLRRDLDEGEYNVATGQKFVYIPDQLGSVRDLLSATTGGLLDAYDYAPYGRVAESYGSTTMDYRFAGVFYHTDSGLYLSATRPLDSATGRWLNRDLLRESAGLNLYAYVGADPMNLFDSSGTCANTDNKSLTPWYSTCTAKALGTGVLKVGIDSIGLIPGAGGVARAIGRQFYGFRGVVADQRGAKIIGRVGLGTGSTSTAVAVVDTSVTGLASTLLGAGGIAAALANATPIVGQSLAWASIFVDIADTAVKLLDCY